MENYATPEDVRKRKMPLIIEPTEIDARAGWDLVMQADAKNVQDKGTSLHTWKQGVDARVSRRGVHRPARSKGRPRKRRS